MRERLKQSGLDYITGSLLAFNMVLWVSVVVYYCILWY